MFSIFNDKKGLYRTIVCRCLIHRPHYFARLMGFGSRGPSESFFFFQIRHGNALNEIACVASVSNRVIARKLEWKQKKSFIFFLLLSQLSRRTSRGNACYAGYERDCLGRRRTGTRYGNVYRSVRQNWQGIVTATCFINSDISVCCFTSISRELRKWSLGLGQHLKGGWPNVRTESK